MKGKREQNPLLDFANILKYCYKKKIFGKKFCKYKKININSPLKKIRKTNKSK